MDVKMDVITEEKKDSELHYFYPSEGNPFPVTTIRDETQFVSDAHAPGTKCDTSGLAVCKCNSDRIEKVTDNVSLDQRPGCLLKEVIRLAEVKKQVFDDDDELIYTKYEQQKRKKEEEHKSLISNADTHIQISEDDSLSENTELTDDNSYTPYMERKMLLDAFNPVGEMSNMLTNVSLLFGLGEGDDSKNDTSTTEICDMSPRAELMYDNTSYMSMINKNQGTDSIVSRSEVKLEILDDEERSNFQLDVTETEGLLSEDDLSQKRKLENVDNASSEAESMNNSKIYRSEESLRLGEKQNMKSSDPLLDEALVDTTEETEMQKDISFLLYMMMLLEGEYPSQVLDKLVTTSPMKNLSNTRLMKLGIQLITQMYAQK